MPNFEQIKDPGAFANPSRIDWKMGANGLLNPRKFVDDDVALYAVPGVPGGSIIINEKGPPARLEFCSDALFPVNLEDQSGVITARETTGRDGPYNAPIFIAFNGFPKPIVRLGAYVSVKGVKFSSNAAPDDVPLVAILWFRSAKTGEWAPIAAIGKSGRQPVSPFPSPQSAPFVGVAGAEGIDAVAFDMSQRQNIERLVLGGLWFST